MSFDESLADKAVSISALTQCLDKTVKNLVAKQKKDGHFVFELEADCTIPAEYILLCYYRDELIDRTLENKIQKYLIRQQKMDGGWPLFFEGASNISVSVKVYFALKMMGEPIDSDHMLRARQWILSKGGASRANVFTRNLLALFKIIPWSGVPVMPVEIMHLPRWFPFHLEKISYWARTVLVPLTVLNALKPEPRSSKCVKLDEIFCILPEHEKDWPGGPIEVFPWTQIFKYIDRCLRLFEPWFPKSTRESAIQKAVLFVNERINGEDGLGAIFPAMFNSVLMYDALKYPQDHQLLKVARTSIDKLLIVNDREAYCQPCLSPVWDTALVAHALIEVGSQTALTSASYCTDWLKSKQILDIKGDWSSKRPHIQSGGWAFQYSNPFYPDVDDTAVVAMALDRISRLMHHKNYEYQEALKRATEWIIGMQSANGGWGAFDVDNEYYYLNNIPFADHGALLDPPTADVSARCISMLSQVSDNSQASEQIISALDYLRKTQEKDGSWYGRWGMNYIYGTWSALCAFNASGIDPNDPVILKAVEWLLKIQNKDGGWGEDGDSYKLEYSGYEKAPSTPSQTAWALLGLMAAGAVDQPQVEKGIRYLLNLQKEDGFWQEQRFTATGFPRVFYLRYHGYSKVFPLWALARYKNLKSANTKTYMYGM